LALLAALLLTCPAWSEDLTSSLKQGTPDVKSLGSMSFGPQGLLFVADSQGSAIFAIATNDTKPAGNGELNVQGVDEKIASLLGTTAKDILIKDLAVNPASGNVYLTVARGTGPSAVPVVVKFDRKEGLKEFPLKDVKFAKATLPNAVGNQRAEAFTDIAYINGRVFVAGLSNEEFKSRLRAIPFPFGETDTGAGIEIYHGAHGKFETASPVRTFTHYKIGGQDHLLAAYTCTPLVKIPVDELKAGAKVKGVTVAELGNRNNPLDMIMYQKDGTDYILMANSSRGIMKVKTEGIDKIEAITKPVTGGGTAGLPYEKIEKLTGVEQLDKLDAHHAVLLVRKSDGTLNLETVELP
jgi:hypothetical protein